MAAANFSHFVGGLGFGKGFDRGNWVVGGGSIANGPSAEDRTGNENSDATRTWQPSRAVDWRNSSQLCLNMISARYRHENVGVLTCKHRSLRD